MPSRVQQLTRRDQIRRHRFVLEASLDPRLQGACTGEVGFHDGMLLATDWSGDCTALHRAVGLGVHGRRGARERHNGGHRLLPNVDVARWFRADSSTVDPDHIANTQERKSLKRIPFQGYRDGIQGKLLAQRPVGALHGVEGCVHDHEVLPGPAVFHRGPRLGVLPDDCPEVCVCTITQCAEPAMVAVHSIHLPRGRNPQPLRQVQLLHGLLVDTVVEAIPVDGYSGCVAGD
mmetsp:Transcript_32163/g.75157  ORF Transcript_32163/g.75157 Transcript_32163/m.75157 type:complete len:232 (+) Transcript_32163:1-696(+)